MVEQSAHEGGQPDFNSPEEREFFDEVMGKLNAEGGRTEQEKMNLAMRLVAGFRKINEVPF